MGTLKLESQVTLWMLGTKPGSFARAAGVLTTEPSLQSGFCLFRTRFSLIFSVAVNVLDLHFLSWEVNCCTWQVSSRRAVLESSKHHSHAVWNIIQDRNQERVPCNKAT